MLVKLMYLDDDTSFVPSFRELSTLALYADMVTNSRGWESLSVFCRHGYQLEGVGVTKCVL